MARPNVPHCKEAINVADAKISYLLLNCRRMGFEFPGANGNKLGVKDGVTGDKDLTDANNPALKFEVVKILHISKKRAALKLKAKNPTKRGVKKRDFLDGILSITLLDLTDPQNIAEIAIADVPVDYIVDDGT